MALTGTMGLLPKNQHIPSTLPAHMVHNSRDSLEYVRLSPNKGGAGASEGPTLDPITGSVVYRPNVDYVPFAMKHQKELQRAEQARIYGRHRKCLLSNPPSPITLIILIQYY